MGLECVYDILEEINNVSSRLGKIDVIKKHINNELFKKVVKYAYDPYMKFNVKKIQYIESEDNKDINDEDIFKMLNYLASKRGATSLEISTLSLLASKNKKTFEVVKRIINKDLRCGASVKTFRKCGIDIPEYGVMLCIGGERKLEDNIKSFKRFFKAINNDISNAVWSEKKNGVRCTTNYINNQMLYLSRSGREYSQFNVFDNEIKRLYDFILSKYNVPVNFDGEVVGKDKTQEGFDKLISNARRLSKCDPSIFEYHIFDIIVPKDVIQNYTLEKRYTILKDAFESTKDLTKLFLVEHYQCDEAFCNLNNIFHFIGQMSIEKNWEGIVIKNKNSIYEFKRSQHWIKMKANAGTIDVFVLDYIEGAGKYRDKVGALLCETKDGIKFKVGSGFTDEDRITFMEKLPEVIEVTYQTLTKDNVPLMPTFIRVRDDI